MEKFWKIIKYLALTILFVICIAIIVRILIMTDASKLSTITATDSLVEAYNANGTLDIKTHKVYDEISKEGYFAAYSFVYISDIKEAQFTLRYNDSIYSYNDFEEDAEFLYFFYNKTTNELIAPVKIESDSKLMYNYRRVVFDGFDLDDGSEYYVYIAYEKDIDEVQSIDDCFDNLPIHYPKQEWKNYSLSKKDKESLDR